MAAIFQTTFSNAFLLIKGMNFHLSLFLMVQLKYWSIGSEDGLAPVRRQAIIWTNDG